jgi:3-oxoacid CoA-transferase A subunit
MKKVVQLAEAVEMIPDGATVMVGGFLAVGTPLRLVDELTRQRKKDLTVIANDTARPALGIGRLVDARLVRKVVVSHIGTNPETQRQMLAGEIEVELVPQGTFSERIRAAGAGIGGFFTPTAYGTVVAEGKETRVIDGKPYVLESPLGADFAFVKAWQGDRLGNLVYRRTARNFNPVMATAARTTIAEVEELVEPGRIDPDHVITPGIFVKHIIQGAGYEKRIEKRTVRSD